MGVGDGGGYLLAGEHGFDADGVVDRVVCVGEHLLICSHGVGHRCGRWSSVKSIAQVNILLNIFLHFLEAQGKLSHAADSRETWGFRHDLLDLVILSYR